MSGKHGTLPSGMHAVSSQPVSGVHRDCASRITHVELHALLRQHAPGVREVMDTGRSKSGHRSLRLPLSQPTAQVGLVGMLVLLV